MPLEIHQLLPDDIDRLNALVRVFGEAFDDPETYGENRPSADYWRCLLAGDTFIALVALHENEVIGGIAAYELRKFEQVRSEIYLYDLAILSGYRRQGIATALIAELKTIARSRGADVIFVQADTGVEDEPALALYTKLGTRKEVLHFDIHVEAGNDFV
jgi:aminoglycoside 3-N-acetyltransferase I